jgi:hypothetical protein
MSVLYPVAASAEEALAKPRARAAREREARLAAGGDVAFATELAGPAFATREAALDAYAGRLDDERPGRRAAPLPRIAGARWWRWPPARPPPPSRC